MREPAWRPGDRALVSLRPCPPFATDDLVEVVEGSHGRFLVRILRSGETGWIDEDLLEQPQGGLL